jgi:hypothetical protein
LALKARAGILAIDQAGRIDNRWPLGVPWPIDQEIFENVPVFAAVKRAAAVAACNLPVGLDRFRLDTHQRVLCSAIRTIETRRRRFRRHPAVLLFSAPPTPRIRELGYFTAVGMTVPPSQKCNPQISQAFPRNVVNAEEKIHKRIDRRQMPSRAVFMKRSRWLRRLLQQFFYGTPRQACRPPGNTTLQGHGR